MLEQPGGEALLSCGLVVAQDPGNEPAHRLDDDESGHLSPGQDVVTKRDLAIDQVVPDPIVDALVTAAQKPEAFARGQTSGHALVEALARGVEQVERPSLSIDGLDR